MKSVLQRMTQHLPSSRSRETTVAGERPNDQNGWTLQRFSEL